VLRPGQREPEGSALHQVRIDDRVLWDIGTGIDSEVDEGRAYWAYYQGPAGDYWYTSNPARRSGELVIRRVRSRRLGPISRGNRALVKSIERGLAIRTQSIQELNAMAEEHRKRREKEQDAKHVGEAEEPPEGSTDP
jgi:hypothetical protein